MSQHFINREKTRIKVIENELICSECLFNLTGDCQGECMTNTGISEDRKEDEDMKFIWGIISSDDLSGVEANLYTMNDFDIIYWKDTKTYSCSLETVYLFESQEGKLKYLNFILDAFTDWMKEQGYSTERPPFLPDVFSYGQCMNSEFYEIEDLYINFKMLVLGYCACFK